jgi:hypothetical protein
MNPNSNSHEPLIDSALIGLDLTAEHHLANCPCCQGEREKTERALRQFADQQREQASRPESFWEEQAGRIRAARSSLTRRAPFPAVLVPALALLLVLGLELTPRRQPPARPPNAQVQAVSDHDLLVAVERAVDNATPYALEPVALAVEEPESNSAAKHTTKVKEADSHAN